MTDFESVRRLRVKKLPGTHAVRIMLGATLLAGVGSVISARYPGHSVGEGFVTESSLLPTGDGSGGSGSAATRPGGAPPTQAPTTDEGAVPEPQPEQLPSSEQVSAASVSRFSMPLKAWSKVTDRYGAKNRGPGLIHGGIDLALEGLSHSDVFAACSGSVTDAKYSSAYGNHIFVDCGDGWSTLYGHLSKMLVGPGDAVSPEVAIGVTGSTGFSTGEHLHFEIRWQDTPVNPEHYLEFHIPAGTPLSDGPLWFPSRSGSAAGSAETPSGPPPTPTDTPTPTNTPTNTPTPTITPTPTWTPTPSPTPRPPTRTPTPVPVAR